MKKKNILVFLHAKDAEKNDKRDLIEQLAAKFDAEILALNAPLPYKNGYQWWRRENTEDGRKMIPEDFNQSVEFIVSEVNQALGCNECGWERIILCGHSQGGMMAVHLGLTMHPGKVISLCGDFPDYLNYGTNIDKNVPIYWIEAGKDEYLSQERLGSYKKLQEMGCNLKYFCSPLSTHINLDTDIIGFIGG